MTLFFRRFIGALMLDADAFEDIEAHRDADMQSVVVLLMACGAGGMAAAGLAGTTAAGFAAGTVVVLGAWLVWVTVIASIGTIALAEPQTNSSLHELLRTLGFAAAPAVFLVFAAIRTAAPFVLVLVAVWMVAAAVLGMRQALDYRSLPRAIAVCALGLIVSIVTIATIAGVFSVEVS